MALTHIEKRVLTHIPDWAADEAWHVENEGGPDVSVRFHTLEEMTRRLAADLGARIDNEDGSVRPITEPEVLQTLQVLEAQGLAEERDGGWRMTEAGFNVLTGPAKEPNTVPGPV